MTNYFRANNRVTTETVRSIISLNEIATFDIPSNLFGSQRHFCRTVKHV